MARYRRLCDTYRFPGFRPEHTVTGIFGDPKARVIRFVRRGKKRLVVFVALFITRFTTARSEEFETSPAGMHASFWKWRSEGWIAEGARR
jgi:hypothetical protein